MSLVMKNRTPAAGSAPASVVAKGLTKTMARDAEANRKRARTLAKQQQAAERVASASSQLSAGINEAASASEELKRASDQIASGAEEASGAAQESLAAITQVGGAITRQLNSATLAQGKAEGMQVLAGRINSEVQATVGALNVAAKRQGDSVKMVGELERQAANIGDIVKAVARIADQTNLLALNAAIEAARAGQHGKGFAVVADELRTLAETSEKSAKQIQDLVGQIQGEVKVIAGGINTAAETIASEVEKSDTIVKQLDQIRADAAEIVAGPQLALGANSPFFFGHHLWAETRVELFAQATDTRPDELKAQGVRPRVWFGERWITSIFDLFEENSRYFPALLAEYPDAIVIQNHRDPLKVIASISALGASLREMTTDNFDVRTLAAQYGDDIMVGLDRALQARTDGLFAPGQVVDVRYQDFRHDPIATIAHVYDQIGLELTVDTEARMRSFLAAHPGDQAGSLKRYSFADTGLDEDELRERARPYQEFFGVETEQLS